MLFLRQRRRAAARRLMEELAAASAWSPRVVVPAPIRTDRRELGSAARVAREARGWARLDRPLGRGDSMARRIWGRRHAGNRKHQMGRLQKTLALLAVVDGGVATAALLGGSSYALMLVTGGTTGDTIRSLQAMGPTRDSDKAD